MFCRYCGAVLEEGTNFCPHCGAKSDDPTPQSAPRKSRATILFRVLIIATLILFAAALFMTGGPPHCQLYYTGYFDLDDISEYWTSSSVGNIGKNTAMHGLAYLLLEKPMFVVGIGGLISLLILLFPVFTKKAWTLPYFIPTILITAISLICSAVNGISKWFSVGKISSKNVCLDYFRITAAGYAYLVLTFCALLLAVITTVYLVRGKKKGILGISNERAPFWSFPHKVLLITSILLLILAGVFWPIGGRFYFYRLTWIPPFSSLSYEMIDLFNFLVLLCFLVSVIILIFPILAKRKWSSKHWIMAKISVILSFALSVSGFIVSCIFYTRYLRGEEFWGFELSRIIKFVLFAVVAGGSLFVSFLTTAKIKKISSTQSIVDSNEEHNAEEDLT